MSQSSETIIPHLITSQSETNQLLTNKPEKLADLKLVLLGESSVGKSSILQRIQNNTFDNKKPSTIGAAFISKKIFKNEGKNLINLQIWDTAGQERFHNLTPLYYRNSNLALIVFDLNDLNSFKKAEYWINELKMYKNDNVNLNLKILLIGNKLDLLQEQQEENGEQGEATFKECEFSDTIQEFLNLNKDVEEYFKTSAKLNIGLYELFNYLIDNIDDSLFYDYRDDDDDKKNGKGLIDLRFRKGGNLSSSNNGCQC